METAATICLNWNPWGESVDKDRIRIKRSIQIHSIVKEIRARSTQDIILVYLDHMEHRLMKKLYPHAPWIFALWYYHDLAIDDEEWLLPAHE